MIPVKLSELISAIEGQSEENVTRVDLKTGEVVLMDEFVLRAVEEDNEEALKELAIHWAEANKVPYENDLETPK